MNVYDFDKTIYDGDSTIDFYFFCLKRHPQILFLVFKQIYGIINYKLGRINKTKMKEYFFCFLKMIPSINKEIQSFCQQNHHKIKKWYLDKKKPSDVIISASPEFLIIPMCKYFGIINVLASVVDEKNGTFLSENCYGEEKFKKFMEAFPNGKINKFYSDSYSDKSLADIACESFWVNGDKIINWNIKWK